MISALVEYIRGQVLTNLFASKYEDPMAFRDCYIGSPNAAE